MTDKKLIIFVAVGIILCVTFLSFAFKGNQEKREEQPAATENINITIRIDYPEDVMLKDYEKKKFRVPEDSAVLDAINLFIEASDMPFDFDKDNEKVTNVNNIMNGDFFDTSHWIVKVNDKKCDGSLSATKLKDKDIIELVFIEK